MPWPRSPDRVRVIRLLPPSRRATNREEGAAVAGFALTAGLTTLVFLTVLQFAFILHTKAVLIDAAGQGARVAARHGSSTAQGIEHTTQILSPLAGTPSVTAQTGTAGGVAIVTFTVTSQLPVLGPFGIPGLLSARGNALVEDYDRAP